MAVAAKWIPLVTFSPEAHHNRRTSPDNNKWRPSSCSSVLQRETVETVHDIQGLYLDSRRLKYLTHYVYIADGMGAASVPALQDPEDEAHVSVVPEFT